MLGQTKDKKGIIFTMDAIFAGLIIVIAIIAVSKNFIHEDKTQDLTYISYDLVKSFSSIKTSELNNSYLKQLISSGVINNTNNTLLETIGELYVLNMTTEANLLARNISAQLIPSRYGFSIAVNSEEVYSNNKTVEKTVMTAKRLISGIEKYKPIRGSTSKVYLEGLEEKKDSTYIFFGGFIGQGNISEFTDDIPSDAVISNIYMEMEIGDTPGDKFNLTINGIPCISNFTKKSSPMTADTWNITSCKDSVVPGERNNVSLTFVPWDNFNIAYISGGFFRFDYTTREMYKEENNGYDKTYFPSIDGLINIYSSIYIPGDINDMEICVKYLINHTNSSNSTFYLKVGNNTIFRDTNSTEITTQCLDGSVLVASGINYTFLSRKNIPIRLGAENVSYYTEYIGNADVTLITDLSGSMNWKMDSDGSNGGVRSCDDPDFNSSDTQRLAVAKCLDMQFTSDMLNITGNLVGLIGYRSSTDTSLNVNLTNNQTLLNDTILSYNANGGTCICCGINSGKQILNKSLKTTLFIANGSEWKYNNFSFKGPPANDSANKEWHDIDYNDSDWHTGTAILGSTNGYTYSPLVNKEIGFDLDGSYSYVNLWENTGDTLGAPNDFSSGVLNSTANTFGISGNDDGWDWDTKNGTGPFGFDDDIDYNLIQGGKLSFDNRVGGSNSCANFDCSGAYGIEINITPEMYTIIQSEGKALFSFYYEWNDVWNDPFENDDQVWIKAKVTTPSGESYYLGSDKDTGHLGSDSDNEIETRDDPNLDFSGIYFSDIADYITSSGSYYLEFGGKLNASGNNEYGDWYFDNIELYITNATDHYYFRKEFTITDLTKIRRGVVNVLSDDRATIYINGNVLDSDYEIHDAEYWNRAGKTVSGEYFVAGNNIIAVELLNSYEAAKFDLELIGINDSRTKAMLIMTDGQGSEECTEQNTGDPTEDAIKAACMAAEDYGIKVYSVGFSTESDQYTIEEIAKCGNGLHARSSQVDLLKEFYKDVAAEIMDVARVEQKIVVTGNPTSSKLYGQESYIQINYTPPVKPPEIGEISFNFNEPIGDNCTFLVNLSSKLRVIDSKVTSYSSSKWTDYLFVNGVATHNLSVFNPEYEFLGDPFIVSFDPSLLNPGSFDNISLRVGIDPINSSGCSENSTLLYTALMKSTISYSEVLEFAEGCSWTIEFEDLSSTTLSVPPSYSGSKSCTYMSSGISYNANDTYDDAVYQLFYNLDLDDDGRVDVNLVNSNLIIGAISVNKVPYPWGPAIAEVRIWQ